MEVPPAEHAIAHYERLVAASHERVWENVLDWEHLPWLHRHAFSELEPLAASRSGWRVRVATGADTEPLEIELETDRPGSAYVARTLSGAGAGTEIWTTVVPQGERETQIEVTFHVPGLPESVRADVGRGFVTLYSRLWDEDEAMMIRRQAVLDGGGVRVRPASTAPVSLGPADALRDRAPCVVDAGGVSVRIARRGDSLVAHPFVCPHLGGPLEEDLPDGTVRCPWHGYAFDPSTGAGCGAHRLRLPFTCEIDVDPTTGDARLRFGPARPAAAREAQTAVRR